MQTSSRKRFRPAALALATVLILVALSITPTLGWLVRAQVAMSQLGANPFLGGDTAGATERLALRLPNDFPVQLVRAQQTADQTTTGRLRAVRALETRFPNTPSLYANALRYAMQEGRWGTSDGDWALDDIKPPRGWRKVNSSLSPAQWAAFDRDAAQGERLDPDNAYFPLMRAVGLFGAQRNTEALAAVERASQKTAWREYYQDEVEGHWRVQAWAVGGPEALGRVAIAAAVLFPHYARLRGLARGVAYQAVLTEQAGHAAEGLAIRRALMRCGALMQTQSPSLIGSLVGTAIAAIAMARPGGTPPIHYGPSVSEDEQARRRLTAFRAYAHRLGHDDAAREAQRVEDNGRSIRDISKRGLALSVFGVRPLQRLMAWWTADLVTLGSIALMLLFGGAAALSARLPRVRADDIAAAPVVLGRLLLWLGVAMVAMVIWAGEGRAVFAVFGVGQSLLGMMATGSGSNADRALILLRLLTLAGTVAAPLLTLAIVGLVSLARPSLSPGRAFRSAAVTLVLGLALLYSGLLWGTLRQEQAVNAGLTQIERHEGPYLARLLGQTWPG